MPSFPMPFPEFLNRSIRARLTVVLALIGLIPGALAAVVLTVLASSETKELQGNFDLALRSQVFDQLDVLRESRGEAIESYFSTVGSQLRTLAEDRMVVSAMSSLNESFTTYRDDLELEPSQLKAMRAAVKAYYAEEVAAEYSRSTGGASLPEGLVTGLSDDGIAMQYTFLVNNPNPLEEKDALVEVDEDSEYTDLHSWIHESLRAYQQEFGFYDLYFVSAEGADVVYSVFKGLDFGSNLETGPYAESGLGEVFREAMLRPKGEVAFADFELYTPSFNSPAAFMGTSVWEGDEAIGALIFEMPIDRISSVMNSRTGLGETGEAVLVGADGLMRSDSFIEPERLSVVQSFRDPVRGHFASEALERARTGQAGQDLFVGPDGVERLASYAQIDVAGKQWSILTRIDKDEALAAVAAAQVKADGAQATFIFWGIGIGLLALIAVSLVGPRVARSISIPIGKAVETIEGLAKGDLSQTLCIDSQDELGQMAKALSVAIAGMHAAVRTDRVDWASLGQQRKDLGRINSMVENSELGMIFFDRKGAIRYMNPSVVRGLTAAAEDFPEDSRELIGRRASDLHSDPEVAQFSCAAPEELPWTKTITLGSETIDVHAVAIFDADKTHIGTMMTWDFVTERVRAIEAEQKALAAERAAEESQKAQDLQDKVDHLLDAVTAAAAGDLTAEILVSGTDAIGRMGEGFAVFLKNLRGSMQEIRTTTEELSSAAELMGATADELGQTASQTSNQANGAASVAEVVSANVQSVTSGTDQLIESIREISANAMQAAQVAQEAVGVTEQTAAAVTKLGESSMEIDEVLRLIASISEQTNLLALNATIEAARAGDAGKGFAVVANEVKELASETARATEEISGKIAAIQSDATHSAEAIENVSLVIERINDISSSIAGAVEEQTATTGEMGRSVSEAASGTAEILEAVSNVAQAADSTAAGVSHSTEGVTKVAEVADSLRLLVDRFEV